MVSRAILVWIVKIYVFCEKAAILAAILDLWTPITK